MKLWQILQQYDIGTEEQKSVRFQRPRSDGTMYPICLEGGRVMATISDSDLRPGTIEACFMGDDSLADVWELIE